MKVLFVVSAMLPWEIHGVAVHVHYLTSAMKDIADVTIMYTVAAHRVGNKVIRTVMNGIKTILIPADDYISFPENTPCGWMDASFPMTQCWSEIAEIIGKEEFDIIHFQDYYTALAVELAKSNSTAKIVTTIHAVAENNQHISSGIQYWLMQNSDAIVAVSQWEENLIRKRFSIDQHLLTTIYNGTNMKYERSEVRDLITFAGRLEKKKGCDILLKAIARIGPKRLTEYGKKVVIAGDGSQLTALKQLSNELKISEVCSFVGALSHEEISKLLTRSSVHVVPSRHEPFGLTSIEAMAKGSFTIVSNTGGLPETMVAKQIGVCIEPDNVDALATSILEQLNSPCDEGIREFEAQKVQSCFNWNKVAKDTLDLYHTLV